MAETPADQAGYAIPSNKGYYNRIRTSMCIYVVKWVIIFFTVNLCLLLREGCLTFPVSMEARTLHCKWFNQEAVLPGDGHLSHQLAF